MNQVLTPGVRYMLYATFTFALMKVFVKAIPHIPAIEIIFFRAIVSLAISFYFLKKQKVSIWGNNKPVLIARGVTGSVALILYFYLLHAIPLATAATLQYLAPIFTTVLGVFIVKEKVNPWQWVFFAISFVGVMVVQGFDVRISYLHLGIGIATSFFMGLAYNFVRKLNTTEHPLVIILYFPLVLLPIGAVWSYFVWVTPVGWDWLMLLGVGILTQIAQFFMTKSYQHEEVSKVSILNYVGLIYALLFGFFLFDETFNIATYMGMALVVVGVIANVVFKKKIAG
ncbi:MAG: EamA family transporter [Cytophagales bacterium]|nr:EamA family transporter [Cytophagales bacterium]